MASLWWFLGCAVRLGPGPSRIFRRPGEHSFSRILTPGGLGREGGAGFLMADLLVSITWPIGRSRFALLAWSRCTSGAKRWQDYHDGSAERGNKISLTSQNGSSCFRNRRCCRAIGTFSRRSLHSVVDKVADDVAAVHADDGSGRVKQQRNPRGRFVVRPAPNDPEIDSGQPRRRSARASGGRARRRPRIAATARPENTRHAPPRDGRAKHTRKRFATALARPKPAATRGQGGPRGRAPKPADQRSPAGRTGAHFVAEQHRPRRPFQGPVFGDQRRRAGEAFAPGAAAHIGGPILPEPDGAGWSGRWAGRAAVKTGPKTDRGPSRRYG